MKKIITEEDFESRYQELLDLRKGILNRWNDISFILAAGGLTPGAIELDKVLFGSHIKLLKSEGNHLIGRELLPGEMYASIPFDVPSFLTMQYTGPAFLAGMPITLHFASAVKELGSIWEEIIVDKNIKNYTIDSKLAGREFGEYALKDNEIKHFVLAGGLQLLRFYKNIDMTNLDSLTVFGPTRPKTLFLSDLVTQNNDSLLEDLVKKAVYTSMFGSGQLCALDKELIPVKENYETVKQIAIDTTKEIKQTDHITHYVLPIKDKPTFNHAIEQLKYFRSKPKKYKILVGGEVNESEQYISPTLIEANGVDHDIDGFWPYIILNRSAETDNDAVEIAKADKTHGVYAFINTTDPNKFYSIEKELLGGHFTTVLGNANVLNHSISQPYGGFKDSFILRRRQNGRLFNLKGNHYIAHIVTRG